MPDLALRSRTGASAKALLLTIVGEFTARHGASLWTSSVVEALATLDINERNARQSVARLADEGLLQSERHGRRTRWHLTPAGQRLLSVGTARIYGFGAVEDAWDGQWLVVLASVPEEQRAKRHHMRSQLAFAGFGFIAPGIAISPHIDRELGANALLAELDLPESAAVFIGRTGTMLPDRELIQRAWDLDALAARYVEFIADFDHRLPNTGAACFRSLVELVHEWRRFPFGDPEIPDVLLPDGWPGRRAKQLFDACHATWSPAATAWYLATEASDS
jgi:phenylacetic acid degradation operon negative regulatory protein